MINVIIVDDHALVRKGISEILSDQKGIKVIAELSNGEAVVDYMRQLKKENSTQLFPDIILMDIQMPGIGGIEATRKVIRSFPDVKVIALTALDSDPFPATLMKVGASGYMTKSTQADDMIQAIRMVKTGQRYISPEIAQKMALKSVTPRQEKAVTEVLSDRELQVLLMITRGIKVPEIASKLCLSTKTINSYRYRIFEKLEINSDVELTHLAIRMGLVDNMQGMAELKNTDDRE